MDLGIKISRAGPINEKKNKTFKMSAMKYRGPGGGGGGVAVSHIPLIILKNIPKTSLPFGMWRFCTSKK